MKRGFAITIVYLGLLLVPILLIAAIVPPLITEANNFADNVPTYADDVTDYVQKNERLREINEDYDITAQLEKEAQKLPNRLGGAAGTLRDVGLGIVNSVFALITILVLTAFLLSSGRTWIDAAIASRPPEQRERLRRARDNMASAVSGYVAGALTIAVIAGVATYIVLAILGVPFKGPLAVMAGLFSLIPLVGATIAAVLIGIVTLFQDFPTATIIWTIWAIVYQQLENHLLQPQIQKRTVNVHPLITIVAVLFGGTLLGILGAIVAIPVAASIQILLREYVDLRTLSIKSDEAPPPAAPPPAAAAGSRPRVACAHVGGRAHPPRTAARGHGDLPLPARARADRGLRRVRRAGRDQPALVRRDGRAPGGQLRLRVGDPAAGRPHPSMAAGDPLAARRQLVREGRPGRCGHRRRGAVLDARARGCALRRRRHRASPHPRWSSSPPCSPCRCSPCRRSSPGWRSTRLSPGRRSRARSSSSSWSLLGAASVIWDRPLELIGRGAQALLNRLRRHHEPVTGLPERLLHERDVVVGVLGRKWWEALLLAAGRWVLDYLTLIAALYALGATPRPSLVLLAFCAAQLLGNLPLTPGGVGFVEAGLTGTLALAGVGGGRGRGGHARVPPRLVLAADPRWRGGGGASIGAATAPRRSSRSPTPAAAPGRIPS